MRAKESRQAQGMMGGNNAGRLIGAILLATCMAPVALSATYYVDQSHPSASDSNSGSENAPFATITHAADVVRAGDTVIVKPGTYQGRITFSSINSGTAGNKVTFRAEPEHSVIMDGFDTEHCDHLRVEGFKITKMTSGWYGAGVRMDSSHVEVVNNHVYDMPDAGVATAGDDDDYEYVGYNLIERCQYGITIGGRGSLIEHNEVRHLKDYGAGNDVDNARFFGYDHVWRNNWFHSTAQEDIGTAHLDGFQTWSLNSNSFTQNITITGNVVEGVHQGIMMESNDQGNVRDIFVTNNVFNGAQNWGISSKIGCLNIVILNNIFTNCETFTVGLRNGSSGVIKNNIFYRSERSYFGNDSPIETGNNIVDTIYDGFTPQPGDIHEDPQFVDWDNFNGPDGKPFTADDGYLLQATSPAIDGGTSVSLSEDQLGVARPQGGAIDVGPREMVTGGSAAVTVAVSAPSPALTKNGAIDYVVTYGNADSITLNASDVTLHKTAAANGTVSVSGSGTTTRTVTISNVTGNGTLSISLAADTASNEDNSAPAVGPSATATVDNAAPSITIAGANPLTWAHGVAYSDPGATATDNVMGVVTGDINVDVDVNTSVVGAHSVTYTVTDAVGNTASATRTVNVTDQAAPVLTVLGANPMGILQGGSYVDAGATAFDAVDGDLTGAIVTSGSVDTETAGSYAVTYTVVDAAGHEVNAVRAVNVIESDTTGPVITILGDNPATVTQDETYNDAGATASDDVDGDVTAAISVDSNVDTSAIGDYTVVYTVSDSEGNVSSAVRNVSVTEGAEPGQTFYVESAAAGNGDGSESNPFVSIAEAMNVVEAGRGDTVVVFAGTYPEDVALKAATTLVGVDGAYHTLVTGGSSIHSDILRMGDGSAVRGFTFAGKANGSAIELNPGAHATVSNCVMADGATGLHLREDSVATAINIAIHGMHDYGILAGANSQLTELANSIVSDCNVGIASDAGTVLSASYNAWFNNTTDYEGPAAFANFSEAPLFVEPADYNFHLTSDSPYRNAGDPDAAHNDLDGSRNDLGADGGPQGRIDVLAPFATIFTTVTKATAPITVAFDASGSADEWGIADFSWDFDAIDGIGEDAVGALAEHTFTENGTYTVTLTVVDHNGYSATATANIELGGGEAPTVTAEANPQAGPSPLKVDLSAFGTDPDGGSVTFQWDFNEDGIADDTNATTNVTFAKKTKPGSYKIAVTGTDEEQLSAQATIPITITAGTVKGHGKAKPGKKTTILATEDGKSIAGTQIVLPAGSVSEPVYVAISEPMEIPEIDEAFTVHAVVAIDPDGLSLSMPAMVDLPVDNANDDFDVVVYDTDAGVWTDGPIANVSMGGGLASFTTTRLGTFAVVQNVAPTPVIELTEIAHSVSESENQVTLTVTMNPALTAEGSVTVRYLTANVSAESGVDYTSTTGTLTFDSTKSTNVIVVPILEDGRDESNEAFRVILTDAQGAILGDNATATVTILDNDDAALSANFSGSGCSAGTIGTGSSNPPADFLILAMLVLSAAFGGRLLKRPTEAYSAAGPMAFS